MEIAIENEEAQEFIAKLVTQAKKVSGKASEFAAVLSPIVFKDVMQHFEQQRGSTGPWKAWSKAYAEHMQKIGKGGNLILQNTGRLRQSFTPRNYRVVSDGLLWFNPAKTESGFPYAFAHDEGGPKLPKRDFMWL